MTFTQLTFDPVDLINDWISIMLHASDFDYSSETDSQFTENDDEDITFLEACMECDEDALYDIIQDGVTYEQVNERDRSGRVSVTAVT